MPDNLKRCHPEDPKRSTSIRNGKSATRAKSLGVPEGS